ncbi:MFS transporter [Ramlibacter henchirensis]|uniref:MFS transporter n=1 Tax=Ramlibacter henchirensis TaxID=204072 RepID=A0A4Z0BTT3_9BURK|nr:MFS transporter [Ramlibacter henchirensis]TFZ02693.1 MFS transporter [Ramlibacter henchirensis]
MTGSQLPGHPWLALQVTLAAQMLSTVVLSAAPVLAPAVAPALGLAPERVGLFTGTAYLFAMVSGLAGGPWVNRIGGVRLTQWVLLAVAAGAVSATLGMPAVLLLSAALIGAGYGVVNPAAAAILGRHAPAGSPGLFFSLKQAGVPIGVALSGLLMPLGLVAIGWRGTAWATAAACLALAALLLPAGTRLDAGERGTAPPRAAWLQTLRTVLQHAPLRRLSLVSLAYAMAQQGFLTFSVSLLTLELGMPLALAAALLAASQVACTVMRIVLGHVADRWVTPRVLLGALGLCMSASCVALGALPTGVALPLAALVMVACGATTMGWNGVYFAQLLRTVPREELAASAGGTQFFTFAGGMAGPFLFAQLLHVWGSYTAGYACLAVLSGAAGLVMLWRPAQPAAVTS